MNRRTFLAASGALGALPFASGLAGAPAPARADREYLEWIHYILPVGAKRNRVAAFYRDVAIPALNRLGIDRIGVFTVAYGPNSPSLYVLIPHPSLDSVLNTPARLLDDDTFRQAGAEVIDPPLDDPAFVRMESSLMAAFTEMPRVERPPEPLMQADSRIYELRIYESHSLVAARKKVQMFNEGGEIPIFRRTGLTPVFFGETLVGPAMPNLTYLLVFEDMAARDRSWEAFRNDPDWKTLSADPYYKDTVSNITDIILRPAPFSQI
ncbi:hypothetical protein AWN76_010920 [Rhodothermaceae bacterium RA]|nr:hypothetical protein AWN76_010920 [Rhodothermaceae bacterium RA]